MSADLKDKNKESIDCTMKVLYKMKENANGQKKKSDLLLPLFVSLLLKEKNINVEINVIIINIF